MPISIAALTGVEENEAGVASGLINTSQQIGGAIGLALVDDDRHDVHRQLPRRASGIGAFAPQALVHGFHSAYIVLVGLTVAAALAAAFGIGSPSADEVPEPVAVTA